MFYESECFKWLIELCSDPVWHVELKKIIPRVEIRNVQFL